MRPAAGAPSRQLMASGFFALYCKQAGFSARQLKQAVFDACQLMDSGSFAFDLEAKKADQAKKQKLYEIVTLTGRYDVLASDLEAKNADQACSPRTWKQRTRTRP